jgi:DNA polymerase III epsilon subunit-like protein
MHNWVLVDTETDGLCAPIHAVEIAAQRYDEMTPVGEPFRLFLDHDILIPAEAKEVHGYDEKFLKENGIDPRKAYEEFWNYVGGARIAAHFAQYDWKQVLIPESARLGVEVKADFGFCTWKLAKRALPAHNTWKLDSLREHYKLKGGRAHTALGDIQAVGDLISRIIQPRLNYAGFKSTPHIAAFSNLPVKICHLILGGGPATDPDSAIEKALHEDSLNQKRNKESEEIQKQRLDTIDTCEHTELQRLAAKLGFYGDEVEIQFTNKLFMFTGTLMACKRKEASAEVAKRGGSSTEKWPPDYLVLGYAAPGGSKLRGALSERQVGKPKPIIISEEDFITSLQENPILNPDGSINNEASKFKFTPHKPTKITSQYLSGEIVWRNK